MGSVVRVAAVQLSATLIEQSADTWERIERSIANARQAGADIAVLPECTYPGYVLGSANRIREPDILPWREIVARLRELARRQDIALLVGVAEDTGRALYNSALFMSRHGDVLGVHRKSFLWDCDNDWFSPAETIDAYESELGRVGIAICADVRAPEVIDTLVRRGAEWIAVPTAWVNSAATPGACENIQPEFLIEARAREFGVPFVCADKVGSEPPLSYVGCSRIVGADGRLITSAGTTQPEVIAGEFETGRDRPTSHENSPPSPLAEFREYRKVPRATPPILRVRISTSGNRLPAVVGSRDTSERTELFLGPPSDAGSPTLDPQWAESVRLLSGGEVRRYRQAREAAMDGVRLLCVRDAPNDLALLRARAAENRVFLAASGSELAVIIGPDGRLLATADRSTRIAMADLRLADADDKRVTPRTDIFEQRRPDVYHRSLASANPPPPKRAT